MEGEAGLVIEKVCLRVQRQGLQLITHYREYVLLLLFFGVFATTGIVHGPLTEGDQPTYLAVTAQIAEKFTIRLDNRYWGCHLSMGVDGHLYPTYPPGHPILMSPFYALLGRPGCLLYSALAGAITVIAIFKSCRLFDLSFGVSAAVASIFGFCTPLWTYSRGIYSEQTVFLLVSTGYYFLFKYAKDNKLKSLIAGCSLMGYVVLVRTLAALAWAPLFFYFILKKRSVDALKFLCLLLPWVIIILTYNAVLYGSPFKTGYNYSIHFRNLNVIEDTIAIYGWRVPLSEGLLGLLFDSRHGLFTIIPVCVLMFPGLVHMLWSKRKVELICLFLLFLMLFAPYVTWWWWGGNSFGPRLILPSIIALAIPLGFSFQENLKRRIFRHFTVCIILLSFYINALGALTEAFWYPHPGGTDLVIFGTYLRAATVGIYLPLLALSFLISLDVITDRLRSLYSKKLLNQYN